MLHLNYDDDISVIPELVKQVLVKEKITYSPASDCRYFCESYFKNYFKN